MARTSFKRTDRVGAELRREIGMLVHQAVRDSLLPEISVSDVEVTRDFAHATVYFTVLDNDAAGPALALLKQIGWEFRKELASRLRLRTTPELHFKYDSSVEQGERIERLLRQSGVADTGPAGAGGEQPDAAAPADDSGSAAS
jgi:ribosome-binding factor A